MDEAFACPECGTNVEVRGLAPGRQVRCSFCHRLLEVPYIPRVEAPTWRRRRFARPWWVSWAWAGLGTLAALIIVVAVLRGLMNHQRDAEARSIHDLVSSSESREGQGNLGQALIDLDTAINLCARSSSGQSEDLALLRKRRQDLAKRDAQAVLNGLEEAAVHPFPLGDWLNIRARVSTDPDLKSLQQTVSERFNRKLLGDLERDLGKARGLFESGQPVGAFEACESATALLPQLPPDARLRLHGMIGELAKQIIGLNGIVVESIRGQLLAGSIAKYNATMVPEILRGLRSRGYVPQADSSPWRNLWSAAPYRLSVELNEKLEGNYMSTENRLTRISAHLILSFRGRETWQATPTARTAVPLPNLPAYQSARFALSRDRSAELEKLLYQNARDQIDDKFAFAIRNMAECERAAATGRP
jgi:hypothetical protein